MHKKLKTSNILTKNENCVVINIDSWNMQEIETMKIQFGFELDISNVNFISVKIYDDRTNVHHFLLPDGWPQLHKDRIILKRNIDKHFNSPNFSSNENNRGIIILESKDECLFCRELNKEKT